MKLFAAGCSSMNMEIVARPWWDLKTPISLFGTWLFFVFEDSISEKDRKKRRETQTKKVMAESRQKTILKALKDLKRYYVI